MTTVEQVLKQHDPKVSGDIKTRVYWTGEDGTEHGLVRSETTPGKYEVYSYTTGQIMQLTLAQIEKVIIEKV